MFSSLFTIELTFSLLKFNLGTFFNSDGIQILYDDILLGILFPLSVINILKIRKINYKLFKSASIFIAIIIIGIVTLRFYPARVKTVDFSHSWDLFMRGDLNQMQYISYKSQSILMLVRVIIFISIMIAAKAIYTDVDWINTGRKVLKVFKAFILFVCFEAILKFIFHLDTNNIIFPIFAREATTLGELNALQGLSREPSYFALAVFNICITFFTIGKISSSDKTKHKNHWYWILTILFLGVISSSFSILIVLICLLLIWSYFQAKEKDIFFIKLLLPYISIFIGIWIVILTLNLLISIPILSRITEALTQIKNGINNSYVVGKDFSSEAARLIGIIESFRSYLSRPLLGLGIGTTYCTSGLICILCNIGFIGFIYWFRTLIVHYSSSQNLFLSLLIFFPVILTNDLYTLYDTGYLFLLPVINIAYKKSVINLRNNNEAYYLHIA
jgi:hypothetical protein